MAEDSVTCPKCGELISLTAAMTHSIEARLRKKLSADVEAREGEVAKRESKLKVAEKKVDERATQLAQKQIEEQTPRLREQLKRELTDENKKELDELRTRIHARDDRLKLFEKREQEFIEKEDALAERERRLGLDAKKAIDKERESLVDRVRGEESERWDGQIKEKDLELARVKQALDRAQKAGLAGELAGEAAERTLVERLSGAFGEDQLEPVGRGKPGGDVVQTLEDGGVIIWESKDRYENWSSEWIPKLKRDRDDAKASVGVLVTTVGPGSKPLRVPVYEDGVVLTPPGMVVGVGSLLRPMLSELARQRRLYDKQESLQGTVYAWVTSAAFKNGIAAIAENLNTLKREVNRAKVNHARWFARMEIGVDRTARAVGTFWGSAQGQARLPDIPIMALEGPTKGREGASTDEESEPIDEDG